MVLERKITGMEYEGKFWSEGNNTLFVPVAIWMITSVKIHQAIRAKTVIFILCKLHFNRVDFF